MQRLLILLAAIIALVAVSSANEQLLRSDRYLYILSGNQYIDDITFSYRDDEIAAIAQGNPSVYPGPNTLSDPKIKQQIRKNVLIIIDEMIQIISALPSLTGWQLGRIQVLKQIQVNYANDTFFNSRALPAIYYNADDHLSASSLKTMLLNMAFTPQIFGRLYTSTCLNQYEIVASFGQDAIQGLNITDSNWAWTNLFEQTTYDNLCLTRFFDKNTPVMLNGASPMLSWNVQDYDAADVLSFVRTLPQPQRDFLLSRYVPAGYLSLEHTLVSLARVYSADRANALYDNAMIRTLFSYNWNPSRVPAVGEVAYVIYNQQPGSDQYQYGVMFNSTHYLSVDGQRNTVIWPVLSNNPAVPIMRFVPDMPMADGMVLMQLIADGKLLTRYPSSYKNFLASVDRIVKRL